jgi:hypothetical protein
LQSKADVSSFCLELTKKLDLKYRSPPLPVDLSIHSQKRDGDTESLAQKSQGADIDDLSSTGFNDLIAMFQ